jgi:hypothetical protein
MLSLDALVSVSRLSTGISRRETVLSPRRSGSTSLVTEALGVPSPWAGFLRWLAFCFRDQALHPGMAQMLVGPRRSVDSEVDELRATALDGISALIEGAKAEGKFRADRELEDVLLHLEGHFQLVEGRTERVDVVSGRWFELTVGALTASPRPVPADEVPHDETASVLAVREAYRYRLRGEGGM